MRLHFLLLIVLCYHLGTSIIDQSLEVLDTMQPCYFWTFPHTFYHGAKNNTNAVLLILLFFGSL